MTIIRELGRHVRALGQKLTSENIHNFGQKAVHGARVIGRKMSNTLHKVESVVNTVLPIATKIASMEGYPEAAASAAKHRQCITFLRNFLWDTTYNLD